MTDMIAPTTTSPNATIGNPDFSVRTIYVEITNQCNLNCRTCYNRSGLNRTRKELSAAQFEEILRLFSGYGIKRFLLSGGEPTVRDDLPEIIAAAKRAGASSIQLNSNGLRLAEEPEFTKKLAEAGKDRIVEQTAEDHETAELEAG